MSGRSTQRARPDAIELLHTELLNALAFVSLPVEWNAWASREFAEEVARLGKGIEQLTIAELRAAVSAARKRSRQDDKGREEE